ncbi:MAG: enoyl-CoA hydratase/isomerase family protein [Bdellovibrio sp.]|nr:enoyl-CoA hydratase/isomerase family protein [Bdellovibrio sp.]
MKYLKVENLESDSQIKIVTLNRPEVKNAFNPEMISEITQTFKNFNQDKEIKAVILQGSGSVFCAGADLNWMKEMAAYTYEQNIEDSEKLWDMFESISHCETVVVGIAQGAAYGGALGLLACCDYVVADEKTQFCFSEVKLGLAPAIISSFILKKISDAFARPFMLSAEVFNVNQAMIMGLVNDTKNISLTEVAKKFSGNGLEAMKATKNLLNSIGRGNSWAEQKALTTKTISERRISAEGQQRLEKFLTKS